MEQDEELQAIVSWLPDGKFRFHSVQLFEEMVWQRYFPRQNHLSSFWRQMEYYGFENFGNSTFSHPHFQRGNRALCGQMQHMIPPKKQRANNKKSTRPRKPPGRKKKTPASPRPAGIPPATHHRSNQDATSLRKEQGLADAHSLPQQRELVDAALFQQQQMLYEQLRADQAQWMWMNDDVFFRPLNRPAFYEQLHFAQAQRMSDDTLCRPLRNTSPRNPSYQRAFPPPKRDGSDDLPSKNISHPAFYEQLPAAQAQWMRDNALFWPLSNVYPTNLSYQRAFYPQHRDSSDDLPSKTMSRPPSS
eukprot:scaffold3000_cov84-Cylindrotheca_fusiformis.AAC.1